MEPRKLLFASSSRDRRLVDMDIEQHWKECPHAFPARFYYLQKLGWQVSRLAGAETVRPWRVGRELGRTRPDIVCTAGLTGLSPVLSRSLFTRWRCPIVHDWQDVYTDIWRAVGPPGFWLLVRCLETLIIKMSDFVITPSYAQKERAENWGKRVWYIQEGADLPDLDTTYPVLLEGDFNIVHLGDQSRYKRTEDVVRVMSSLPANIKLYLIGTPYDYLKKYESENVIFLGPRYGTEKYSIMGQADALVSTTNQDCNQKFYEYLRMNKPIIGFDGTPNYLFKNGENALLTRDYRAAILQLYNSPTLRSRLVENARKDIPLLTWEEVGKRYSEVFHEMIEVYGRERASNPVG